MSDSDDYEIVEAARTPSHTVESRDAFVRVTVCSAHHDGPCCQRREELMFYEPRPPSRTNDVSDDATMDPHASWDEQAELRCFESAKYDDVTMHTKKRFETLHRRLRGVGTVGAASDTSDVACISPMNKSFGMRCKFYPGFWQLSVCKSETAQISRLNRKSTTQLHKLHTIAGTQNVKQLAPNPQTMISTHLSLDDLISQLHPSDDDALTHQWTWKRWMALLPQGVSRATWRRVFHTFRSQPHPERGVYKHYCRPRWHADGTSYVELVFRRTNDLVDQEAVNSNKRAFANWMQWRTKFESFQRRFQLFPYIWWTQNIMNRGIDYLMLPTDEPYDYPHVWSLPLATADSESHGAIDRRPEPHISIVRKLCRRKRDSGKAHDRRVKNTNHFEWILAENDSDEDNEGYDDNDDYMSGCEYSSDSEDDEDDDNDDDDYYD